MKRKSSLCVLFALLGAASTLLALNPSEWRYRQAVADPINGAVRFSLPASTLDALRPDLRDLRIVDAGGKEVPYALVRPSVEPETTLSPKDFRVELTEVATTITLETGTTLPLQWVELQTGALRFLKAVQVELSNDGSLWQTLSEGVPIFRQDGATKMSVSLGFRSAAFVRLTLNDERTRPIVVTGARLVTTERRSPYTEAIAPRIVRADEYAGETVLTLDLGARNLSLASLEFSAEDSLFTRNVVVAVRELEGDQINERVLARGAIFRVALDAFTPTADMRVAVNATVPSRQLIVHIENGDSPPLHIYRVGGERLPVHVVAAANGKGSLALLTGNAQATEPHYDIASLTNELSKLPLKSLKVDEPVENVDFQQTDPLAGISLDGAPIDISPWKFHRTVNVGAPGVQEVELDLEILSRAQTSFADLRVVQEGKQLPYVLESTKAARELSLPFELAPDPQRPSFSRWKVRLPKTDLPLTRFVLSSPTPLFDRILHLFESLPDQRGNLRPQTVALAPWIHSPTEKPVPLSVHVPDRLQTDTLWIETDNGDNPAFLLETMRAYYPVTRLLFRTYSSAPVTLYYGNERTPEPRYDVALIANQLLTAERSKVTLGDPVASAGERGLKALQGAHGGVLFWAVLAVVVILLLVVVAKLLPKIPATPDDMK
jgi:hypothetical protein